MKKIAHIFIICTIVVQVGCGKPFRAGRKISKLQSWGYLKEKKDTVWQWLETPPDSAKGSIDVGTDTSGLDSVLFIYKDTCVPKKDIPAIIKSFPCKIKAQEFDDSLYNLKLWVDSGKLKFNLKIKPQKVKAVKSVSVTTVNNPEKCSHTMCWVKFWIVVALLAGSIFSRFKK